MAGNLTVSSERSGEAWIVTLSGRLDAVTSSEAEDRLGKMIDSVHNKLLLDFSSVEYLSSAGMRMLLSITKKMRTLSGKLVLCQVPEHVMDVFKMSGFDHVLQIVTDRDQGMSLLH